MTMLSLLFMAVQKYNYLTTKVGISCEILPTKFLLSYYLLLNPPQLRHICFKQVGRKLQILFFQSMRKQETAVGAEQGGRGRARFRQLQGAAIEGQGFRQGARDPGKVRGVLAIGGSGLTLQEPTVKPLGI